MVSDLQLSEIGFLGGFICFCVFSKTGEFFPGSSAVRPGIIGLFSIGFRV